MSNIFNFESTKIVQKEVETNDLSQSKNENKMKFMAENYFSTENGRFLSRVYKDKKGKEAIAIISGQIKGMSHIPVRVHDQCFTSEVLGSLKCDCREQLKYAMEYIQDNGPGMVIYLQQEGRGIGLANKIAAYALQEKGFDTVDANRELGLPDDCREYDCVLDILDDLEIKSIQLMTNNPRKIALLSELQIQISGRIPICLPPNQYSSNYIKAKVEKMSHLFSNDFMKTQVELREGINEP